MTGVIVFLVLSAVLWWALQQQSSFSEGGHHGHGDEHAEADDLKKIEGIGPKVAELLADAAITTFEALSKATKADLEKILDPAGAIYKAMDPTSWPDQAKLAAKGDWEALEKLQEELVGGR